MPREERRGTCKLAPGKLRPERQLPAAPHQRDYHQQQQHHLHQENCWLVARSGTLFQRAVRLSIATCLNVHKSDSHLRWALKGKKKERICNTQQLVGRENNGA